MTQGTLHDNLGMTLDYSVPGQVSIDVSHYVEKMVKEFPQENLKGASVASPCNEILTSHAIPHCDHRKTVPLQVGLSRYCTSNSLPNIMGTKTKSCILDQVMSNAVISQVNSEGQINLKSGWLWMP